MFLTPLLNICGLDQNSYWAAVSGICFLLNICNLNTQLAQSGPDQKTHTTQAHMLLRGFLKEHKKFIARSRCFYLLGYLYYPGIKKLWGSKIPLLMACSSSLVAEDFHLAWDDLANYFLFIFVILSSECSRVSNMGL